MTKQDPKLTVRLKRGGQKIKHGGYSYITKGTLPEHRTHILKYLTAARENLIRDLGPTEQDLSAAQIIIIDRVITKLGVVRCIEEYIRETTVMDGDRLSPCLRENFLAYHNSIRLDLAALGIDKRQSETMDLQTYINEKYGDKGNE